MQDAGGVPSAAVLWQHVEMDTARAKRARVRPRTEQRSDAFTPPGHHTRARAADAAIRRCHKQMQRQATRRRFSALTSFSPQRCVVAVLLFLWVRWAWGVYSTVVVFLLLFSGQPGQRVLVHRSVLKEDHPAVAPGPALPLRQQHVCPVSERDHRRLMGLFPSAGDSGGQLQPPACLGLMPNSPGSCTCSGAWG